MSNPEKPLGLYVHIPFCLSKCAYCDFCSFPGSSKKLRARYLDALLKNAEEMGRRASEYYCDTVFIGGGTPPLIGDAAFRRLTDGLYRSFYVTDNAEITVEMNPATVEKRFARSLLECGVNRVSIGLQSADDRELKLLGRVHTVRDFEKSFELLRNAGFDNINVDVMYGIPDQTPESFYNTLKYVVSLGPEHISAYGLQLEEGTPFWQLRDQLRFPDEDAEYAMYCYACEYLTENGYNHYEISNFARPDRECRHNKKYWNGDRYIGLGCSAHSSFEGMHYGYTDDPEAYIGCMERGEPSDSLCSEREQQTVDSLETEYVMLRFRLAEGIDKRIYRALFGADFDVTYRKRLEPFIAGGFVTDTPECCALTADGMYVSNTILSSVLDL